ncbi:hypothetical protein ACFW1A_32645 [Kitasatospora sp. NPDC058965]|uniref:hypothetical protein n=1 Tax=Kitasatospora sp. NPDC058965 TaxID=3346682 RepID=UPI003699F77C
MDVSALVRAELARHHWAALPCGCGESADHLRELFESELGPDAAGLRISHAFEGHIERNGRLFPCSPPSVAVLIAALAAGVPDGARSDILDTFWYLSSAEFPADLLEQCLTLFREGLWTLLQAGLTGTAGDAETVADICEQLDPDRERAAYYRHLLQDRVRLRTKRRKPVW